MVIKTYISIINLNINNINIMFQPADIDWLVGYKNKACVYCV